MVRLFLVCVVKVKTRGEVASFSTDYDDTDLTIQEQHVQDIVKRVVLLLNLWRTETGKTWSELIETRLILSWYHHEQGRSFDGGGQG